MVVYVEAPDLVDRWKGSFNSNESRTCVIAVGDCSCVCSNVLLRVVIAAASAAVSTIALAVLLCCGLAWFLFSRLLRLSLR